MHFLVALLQIAAQPAASPIDREIEKMLAGVPGDAACSNPSEEDMRPYTLCLAEARFEDAESEMERQLTITLTNIEAARGSRAAKRFAADQFQWTMRRDRKCAKAWADSPVTQVARNTLACQAFLTEQRTISLKASAVSEKPGRP